MTRGARQLALGGALAFAGAAALVGAGLAARTMWRSPPGIAWRWRGDFEGLRVRCTVFFPGYPELDDPPGTVAECAALRILALERMRSADPMARAKACEALTALADRGAAMSVAEVRATRAAIGPLLRDTRPVGQIEGDLGRRLRVCDLALVAAGRPGCVTASAEVTDRACAEARAEIERELARP